MYPGMDTRHPDPAHRRDDECPTVLDQGEGETAGYSGAAQWRGGEQVVTGWCGPLSQKSCIN